MGAFRAALTQLAALEVAGVTGNYSVETVPEALSRGQLPALLVLPFDRLDSVFNERGSGFESLAFGGGARTVTYTVTHRLLVAPTAAGVGVRSHLPVLIDLIDAYFAALRDDVRLGDTLYVPTRVRVEPGTFTYGGTDYIACAFRHTWVVAV